jgi:UDP-galactopyranose mutase
VKKILVVGAGFSGAVVARELADNNFLVDIIDKRNHVGGNAFDYINDDGIRIHKYGPHLFHTNNESVFKYLSRFTDWIEYKHRVKAMLKDGQLVTLPINNETADIVGEENLIETFIRPYSEKMWGLKLEEIDAQILNRVPRTFDDNQFYFPNDDFQFLPLNGYTSMFENMLNHDNINIFLNTEFDKRLINNYEHVFSSMPIDEYYDFCFGKLAYRSLKFHTLNLPFPKLFDVAQVNFTHEDKFTRVVEWKNLPNHGVNDNLTTITYEEPIDYLDNNLERYYPVKDINGINAKLYLKYKMLENDKVTFIGRLGLYLYLDMHQVVNSSLHIVKNFLNNKV